MSKVLNNEILNRVKSLSVQGTVATATRVLCSPTDIFLGCGSRIFSAPIRCRPAVDPAR